MIANVLFIAGFSHRQMHGYAFVFNIQLITGINGLMNLSRNLPGNTVNVNGSTNVHTFACKRSTLKVHNPHMVFVTCRYTCISEHLQVGYSAFHMVKLYN